MNKKIISIGFLSIIAVGLCILSYSYKNQTFPFKKDKKTDLEGFNTINANNQFAFDLYSQFKENKDENIFFSPYSIHVALTMTYEGARGQTEKEMQSVLHVLNDADVRRADFAHIYNDLNRKGKYDLSTANALWAHKDYQFLAEYITTVEKYYYGKVTNVDFVRESEKSRQTINTWVEEQTHKKIKDLIPHGVLDMYTRLVLTNAIYFKGTWVTQFNKEDTKDEDFTTRSGQIVNIPMMGLTGDDAEFKYAETDEMQLLEIPYTGEDVSMLIILPKENLDHVEELMSYEKLLEWKTMLEKQRVDIFIPKFTFETKYFMVDILKKMGMPSAFDSSRADFSGMDGTKFLFIQNVIHQAFVDVNEEGTEAAAATGVVVGYEIARLIPVFRADHPFIFIILHKDGTILFLGRVNDPRSLPI